MKKIISIFITVFVFSISLYAAGPKKAQKSNVWQGTEISADRNTIDIPCFMPDGDTDFFACTGVYRGHKNQNKEEVKAFALASALDMCSNKMTHTVRGLLIDYLPKDGNSNENKLCVCRDFDEEYYNKTAVSEVARVSCVKYSIKDGTVEAYVGIKVAIKEATARAYEIRRSQEEGIIHNHNLRKEEERPESQEKLSEEEKKEILGRKEEIIRKIEEIIETEKRRENK